MAKIDELLKELCPDEVEWKTIKELFETRNGYTPSTKNSSFWTNGDIPWFKMEDIRDKGHILADAYSHITKSALKGKGLFKANSIILATSATIGEHALITVDHLSNQRFTNIYPKEKWVNKIHMKFVYYYMYLIDEWCKTHVKQGSFAAVDMDGFYKQEIPIPPLSIQQEIVEVLDTFTDALSNLEEELALREKQFEYYREQLFNFDDETSLARKLFPDDREYLTLGKICEVYDGTHQTPKYTTEGIPFISVENIQDIYGSQKCISINDYNAYKVKPKVGDMFMTRIGSIGSCAVVDRQVELAYYVSLALLRPNPSLVNVRYLKHFLESNIGVTEIRKHSLLHAVPLKINKNDICKIMITLCSLSTQQQIVEILDTFEAMIANIKEEIALRTKQYEYYREKLLSFGK